MLISISVPDEVWKKYIEQNPTNPRLAAEQQLVRFQDVSKGDRPLVIKKETLSKMEALRGTTFENAEDLLKWIEALTHIKIEDITVPLREGQRKYLEAEAKFFKKDPVEFAKVKLQRILSDGLGGN